MKFFKKAEAFANIAAAKSAVVFKNAKAITNVVSFPNGKSRPESRDLAFLPAALEIMETPASPIGRMIAYVIMVLLGLALIWATVGQVDIVATAKGKIVPTGRIKVIQPFETGVVRAIHVHDGQIVKAGDVLIELDSTMNEAESKHVESDLIAARLDVARLQAELADGDALTNFESPPEAPARLVATQRKFLIDQTAEQYEKLGVLDRQRNQKAAEREIIAATIEKLKASLPILEERLEIRKTLFEHTTGSKANYLELLQPFVEQQHELEVQKRRYDEATAALEAITEQRIETEKEYRRQRLAELVEAERKAAGFAEDLVRAQRRAALQSLTTPVGGTVQQLAVHTVGGVVTPAQVLLAVVPVDVRVEIEAVVQNNDIGFVHAGQQAEIKVDTFNFNRYGLIEGRVVSVSSDAIARQKLADKPNKDLAVNDDSSEPIGQELVYAARISLNSTQMEVDGKLVNLTPGMAVTVEIKTGSRRIISYLLSPILKARQEALRER
jgi:hemolysin D